MTTTEDLYQQANETYVEYTDADASNPEHLRFVNRVLRRCSPNHLAVDRIYIDRIIGATAQAADRLEAEHRAAQEKAAAEAEREKLIEQAARAMAAKHNPGIEWDAMSEYTKESFITGARALWDIGWRPAPESDGGAA